MKARYDCKTDEHYNQKYLNYNGKCAFVGFDSAVEGVSTYLNAMYTHYYNNFEACDDDINLAEYLEHHPKTFDTLKETMQEMLDVYRNIMIKCFIDDMNEYEYKQIKNDVDSGILKPYTPDESRLI